MSEDEARLTLPVGERDHSTGPVDAAVTLVEYGDYECSYCGQAYPIVQAVVAHFGDRLRFVFRNFPITTLHPHAEHAAEAAEVAGGMGSFWPMHDLLYENQDALDDGHLQDYAEQLGLETVQFGEEMAAHVTADRVREDFMSGVRSGVNGTPTFFVNGVRYDGSWEQDDLIAALEAELI
jgi:protein-disulfide isomerase